MRGKEVQKRMAGPLKKLEVDGREVIQFNRYKVRGCMRVFVSD